MKMSTEENKAICRRAVEAFNRGDLDSVGDLFDAGYAEHDPSRVGLPLGPEGVRLAWGAMRAAFPDLEATIEDMVAQDDRVAVRGVIVGTHLGELMGIPATGKHVTVSLIDINRIEDGKLVERWGQADTLGMMQQLGAIPQPDRAGA